MYSKSLQKAGCTSYTVSRTFCTKKISETVFLQCQFGKRMAVNPEFISDCSRSLINSPSLTELVLKA